MGFKNLTYWEDEFYMETLEQNKGEMTFKEVTFENLTKVVKEMNPQTRKT